VVMRAGPLGLEELRAMGDIAEAEVAIPGRDVQRLVEDRDLLDRVRWREQVTEEANVEADRLSDFHLVDVRGERSIEARVAVRIANEAPNDVDRRVDDEIGVDDDALLGSVVVLGPGEPIDVGAAERRLHFRSAFGVGRATYGE